MKKGFVVSEKRKEKAKKIEAVLKDFLNSEIDNKKILDIGTGNGEIAEYFVKKNKVYSVDITDQRKNKNSKVVFKRINSEKVPFRKRFFDIVISNHVIEHLANQELHLRQIKKVLKNGGICYLATPNKLFPWETHYKVFLIHYLPKKIFNGLLNLLEKYEEDIYLLNYFKLKKLISKFFKIKEYTPEIIKYPDKFYSKFRLLDRLPAFIIKILKCISPTNIFILKNEK